MIHRFAYLTAAVAAALSLLAAAPSALFAQNPPNDRELQIYAGLHAAAASGDVAEIEKLIGEGEPPNLQDASSRTPLIVATYRRHHEAVKTLLRLGANPNARDLQRFDMLTIAVVNKDLDMVKIALEAGADASAVTGPYDGTALISAAHLGLVDIVRELIAKKAPLDRVNSLGFTALLMAVVLGNNSKEHIAVVEALVKAGADVDIKDRQGQTAVGHARARNYDEMLKFLEPATGRKT
jgi:ankyrin repeat protein